jgi:hypothetical protein
MAESRSAPEWGIVELMGHVRLAGRVSETERFGAKLGRIDIPDVSEGAAPDAVLSTQFFHGSSLYRYTPCSEAAARVVAKSNQPQPVKPWELPPQLPPGSREGSADIDDEDDVPY